MSKKTRIDLYEDVVNNYFNGNLYIFQEKIKKMQKKTLINFINYLYYEHSLNYNNIMQKITMILNNKVDYK